jgi:hypothetical protein
MGLAINQSAPDCEADTTRGTITKEGFGDWKAPKSSIRLVPQPR